LPCFGALEVEDFTALRAGILIVAPVEGSLPVRAFFCTTQKQDQLYYLYDILLPEVAVAQLRVGQEVRTGFLPSQVDSCFQSSANPVLLVYAQDKLRR
jgi:hypothetical protein